MQGLSVEQKILLQEQWIAAHEANSKEITLRRYPRAGASSTYGTPALGTAVDTAVQAQLFYATDRRFRGIFGDEVEATLIAELSVSELADKGVSPAIHDASDVYRFVIDAVEYNIVSNLPDFEQIGEELVGVRIALKERE